jgi:hypothetical protein
MWHGAALTRSTKDMPKLAIFLSSAKKKVKGIDEAAIIGQLKAYQKQKYDVSRKD